MADGWMDTQTPAPEWWCGDKCPVVEQLGFSATHQPEQALLLSLASHPHHRRKDRQVKISFWVSSAASECVVPTRFPHAMAVPSALPHPHRKGAGPTAALQTSPKDPAGHLPGSLLTRASSLLCFCVSVFAASSCSWDSDKSCLNCRGGTERQKKKSFYVLGFGTLWPEEAFL